MKTLTTYSKKRYWIWGLTLSILVSTSCQRMDDWLDVKRNKSDVMPQSLADLQALLDNTNIVNMNYPALGQVSSDNLIIPDDRLNAATLRERNAYIWASDIYEGGTSAEFSGPNVKITYANTVLERLPALKETARVSEYNNVLGQAYFFRAFARYSLAQLFCKTYDPSTADSDAGIQLRNSTDPNLKVQRATVKQTYEGIIADATAAAELLPDKPSYSTRGSKPAALGLLAKVYLLMGDFEKSLIQAEKALEIEKSLLDFNSSIIKPESTFRFPVFSKNRDNPEIIFYAETSSLATVYASYGVSFSTPALYETYAEKDLRKTLFFRKHSNGLMEPVGRYTGTYTAFAGIAVNELLLIHAECSARLNDVTTGITDLNNLLAKRFANGSFVPLTVVPKDSALRLVLFERRKELAFTAQARWEDLRRLNLEANFATTLSRTSNGKTFSLPPNDRRYVLPFPNSEIEITGIQQNDR